MKYQPQALYQEFKNIALIYADKACITDEEKSYSYAQINTLVEQNIALIKERQRLAYKNKSDCAILNSNKSCALIYLPKNAHLVAWQLALNALNIAFLTLEYGSKARLEQAVSQCGPLYVIAPSPNELNHNNIANFTSFAAPSKNTVYDFDNYSDYPPECDYIVFSSGSTGAPKKILLGAAPVVEVVKAQAQMIKLHSTKTALWLLNPAFDASLSDIYTALLSGAHLVVSNAKPSDMKKITHLIATYKVSHCDVPPVVFPLWLREIKKNLSSYESFKYIIFGGEKANLSVVRQLRQYVRLYNAYGPTETTVCSSLCEVSEDWVPEDIGTPLPNVLYKIVNGELHIGGSHVALGYDNAQLNHKYYSDENAVRWFMSGDAVELKAGKYLYKGRLDRQFKHNGQLIYPEEIEAAAMRCGAIAASAEYTEEHKIKLYYTGNFQKEKLSENIPIFMLPQLYEKIENIEQNLNQNWKIKIKK